MGDGTTSIGGKKTKGKYFSNFRRRAGDRERETNKTNEAMRQKIPGNVICSKGRGVTQRSLQNRRGASKKGFESEGGGGKIRRGSWTENVTRAPSKTSQKTEKERVRKQFLVPEEGSGGKTCLRGRVSRLRKRRKKR